MAKSVPPGSVKIAGVAMPFVADAVPDAFDERDLEYRPRLQPLPYRLDQRVEQKKYFVRQQKGSSCTGHAVAAAINTVLTRSYRESYSNGKERGGAGRLQPRRKSTSEKSYSYVSPYMLYLLARRYDEFEGEAEAGSSLRGAFKGWFNHGICLEEDWPDLEMETEPDLDDPDFVLKCRERPLGAYYRVNPYRIDDMQSAISELNAIAVSAVIHDGWIEPGQICRGDETMYVIQRKVNARNLGGHAFALVGYNEVGFLVQNSWGPKWGKGGFATLPYEDWLDSAYDAWVSRPGVPQTPFYAGRVRGAFGTNGGVVTAPGPDEKRLLMHVVNLANEGRLSTTGKFKSSPSQIDQIFQHAARWHDHWQQNEPDLKRHIVFYAHGGMVSEKAALNLAQGQLNWWLNNRIYPTFFAWQSGASETFSSHFVDALKGLLPFGGLGFDLIEQFDRRAEKLARTSFRWLWDEMKENARAASDPLPDESKIAWPPHKDVEKAMSAAPGAALVASRLAKYAAEFGKENLAIHLVGHSAGSIFHAAFLQRLVELGLEVESLSLLAPGIRVDEFRRDIFPHLGPGKPVKRFANFALSESLELDDGVGAGGINVYNKSLLYLVSRALERSTDGNPAEAFEVPLLGLQKAFGMPFKPGSSETLSAAIASTGGAMIFSRSAHPADSQCDARTHGAFDNDSGTMTSVLLRALNLDDPHQDHAFRENAALRDTGPSLVAAAQPGPASLAVPFEPLEDVSLPPAMMSAAPPPAGSGGAMESAEAHPPGETPLVETSEPQVEVPTAPPDGPGILIEVADAPRTGSPILDVLISEGWEVKEKPEKK
jgi:hypothetical protein